MAIEIRIESTWDTDDGQGRRVEVTVVERRHPAEDPLEHSRYFASGDVEDLKRYLSELIDRKATFFVGPKSRECSRCRTVQLTEERAAEVLCASCRRLAD
jgi:hypothetical protein